MQWPNKPWWRTVEKTEKSPAYSNEFLNSKIPDKSVTASIFTKMWLACKVLKRSFSRNQKGLQ